MTRTVKSIVEDVLSVGRVKTLWTALYLPALPMSPAGFDIGSVLPVMLYMARWGHRRGKGHFLEAFGQAGDGKKAKPATVADVAAGLMVKIPDAWDGFNNVTGKEQLGDLLLSCCLENKEHAIGQHEQVQRVFPTHYLASWLDLPVSASHLRGVPELLTTLLANEQKGDWLTPSAESRFPVGGGFAANPLLVMFARHMSVRGHYASDLASDAFIEETADDLGIDELLAVRLAQACGAAPLKAKGKDESERIPNRWPVSRQQAEALREDMSVFILVYGSAMPRQAFLQCFESGMALGLSQILLSTLDCLLTWENTGTLPTLKQQHPWPLLVDCSNGQHDGLQTASEASMTECLTRFERFPVLMMLLRVLDDRVRYDRKLRDNLPPTAPDPTSWLNLLGDILHERHERSSAILDAIDDECLRLADALTAENEAPEVAELLKRGTATPATRLAEALIQLMGDGTQRQNYMMALESGLMSNRPNGLARKRRVTRTDAGTKRAIDLRSIVLNQPLLDFLVHRHLRKDAHGKPPQPLSLLQFLERLRTRYGLYVDQAPPGLSVPEELLRANKLWLERRLRDLGLLAGVNDAESMKQLQARYDVPGLTDCQPEAPNVAA